MLISQDMLIAKMLSEDLLYYSMITVTDDTLDLHPLNAVFTKMPERVEGLNKDQVFEEHLKVARLLVDTAKLDIFAVKFYSSTFFPQPPSNYAKFHQP
jgi:hypothetical protein